MQRRSGFVVKGGRHTTRACAGQAVGQWDWRCQYILFPANAGGGGSCGKIAVHFFLVPRLDASHEQRWSTGLFAKRLF